MKSEVDSTDQLRALIQRGRRHFYLVTPSDIRKIFVPQIIYSNLDPDYIEVTAYYGGDALNTAENGKMFTNYKYAHSYYRQLVC